MTLTSTFFRFCRFSLGVIAVFVMFQHTSWSQTAVTTVKRDPADGCTVITLEVQSQNKDNIKDVHLCVSQTNNADSSTDWGDPIKDHFKEAKVVTVPATGFGAQPIQTNVRGNKTLWCAPWTSNTALPKNSKLQLSIKYCGGTGDVKAGEINNIFLTKNAAATFAAADEVHKSTGHYPVFKTAVPAPVKAKPRQQQQSQQERK